MKSIKLRGKSRVRALEGQTLVFRKDFVFGDCGWCIASGNIISEMRTMEWVNPLVTESGEIGQRGKVVGGELILE